MEDVAVVKPVGLFYIQVCALKTLNDEQIIEAVNESYPSGTDKGWSRVVRDEESMKPGECEKFSDRQHLIIAC